MRRSLLPVLVVVLASLPTPASAQTRARAVKRTSGGTSTPASAAYMTALAETSDSASRAACKAELLFAGLQGSYESERRQTSGSVLYGVMKQMLSAGLPLATTPFRRAKTNFDLVEPPPRFARPHQVLSDLLGRMDGALSAVVTAVDNTTRVYEGEAMMSTVGTKATELQDALDSYASVRGRVAETAGQSAPDMACKTSGSSASSGGSGGN